MVKKIEDHRGIGGFGYCVICGLKPGNARFVFGDCPGDWSVF